MPLYEYECEKGHRFEVRQSFSDAPLTACPECQAKVRKLISKANLPHKAGVYVFDREQGGRDILHDPLLSDRERQAALGPMLRQMQSNKESED